MKIYFTYTVLILAIGFGLGIAYAKNTLRPELDSHYLSCLKAVKTSLLYGSSVDTKKELEDYEDRIELYMHLDGYNGVEILEMKMRSLSETDRN